MDSSVECSTLPSTTDKTSLSLDDTKYGALKWISLFNSLLAAFNFIKKKKKSADAKHCSGIHFTITQEHFIAQASLNS